MHNRHKVQVMRDFVFKMYARIMGRNPKSMPIGVVLEQMAEPRPLPIGLTQFEAWSDRIISGALVEVEADSQKFTLADQLLHLGPTESHKPDAFFIHVLRKLAVNQTAVDIKALIKKKYDDKRLAEQAEKETAHEDEPKGI